MHWLVDIAGELEETKQGLTGLYICLVWGAGLLTGCEMFRWLRRRWNRAGGIALI